MLAVRTINYATDIFGVTEESIADVDPEVPTPEPTEEEEEKPKTVTNFAKKALIVSKKPLDCTKKTSVNGIIVGGSIPSDTKAKFIFKIDGNLYRLSTAGKLIAYTDAGEYADVIKNGNTKSRLTGLTSVPGFVGKKVYPIVALYASAKADEMPTVSIGLKTATTSTDLTDTQETPEYQLANSDEVPIISEITANTTIKGDASCTITVSLQDEDETWSDYMSLESAVDRNAVACKFKIKSTVTTTSGADSVTINSINVDHTLGRTVVSGDDAHLYTVVNSYEEDLQTCFVTVRHCPLSDSKIEAYVNFMREPQSRELINIGTGNGSKKTYTLGTSSSKPDTGIDASSIQIYVDGDLFSNFDFNTITGEVSLTAPSGKVITASYDYGHETEVWRKMTLTNRQPYNDEDETWVSRYELTLPDDETDGKKIANVRIDMKRPSGTVSSESLGKAKGKKQLFVLNHIPKAKTINFTNDVDWSYDAESNILEVTAKKNTVLDVSYSWMGEPITVYSYAAGWVAAV